MKVYRTKLKYDFAEALAQIVDELITNAKPFTAEDMLFVAGLAEVKVCLAKKMAVYRPAYITRFTPAQALSLRILYKEFAGYINNPYTLNRMRQIANEVHQHYS